MLYVGTSGWQYRDWRGRFYPKGVPARRWLEHYAARFATVEVNNTFYRLPPPTTFAQWAARVPDDFTIGVKASRYLTHYKRLREPDEPVARLLEHARPLGKRLGPVLVQLPPDLRIALDDLDATLRAFAGRRQRSDRRERSAESTDQDRIRVAVEPRHASWFVPELVDVLQSHGAALCLADRRSRPSTPLWRTTDWTYVRFHSGLATPSPCYGEQALASWVKRIRELWADPARNDVYAYFNNDTGGCAVRDAIVFARLARDAGMPVSRVPPLEEAPVGPVDQEGTSRTTSSAGLSVR
jgi:uncharacterized protein YecE (DUF72 family)